MVRPLLTVPQGALLPDSPGFPNMLAAMTFPSPPKQSTASSSSESVHSLPNRSNPVVGARTSSRRASTSAVTSVTSLDDVMMQRRSSSRSTAATETYRQSAATESSCRRSFRTELTDMSEEAFARPLPSIDRQPKGLGDSEEVASSERSNTPNTTSSLAGPDQEPTPAVVEDRRKARQAKVRQYKQRDVRLSKEFASVPSPTSSRALDSPVLGWSPSRGHRPVSPSSSLRSRNSAECRHAASRGSISLEMDGSSSVSESTTIESTQNERSRSPKATSSAPNPAGRATNVRANAAGLKHETKVPWEFSPVMVTCVEPSPSPAPVLTISPVIIVADVASQPNRTLRPSASSQWTDYGAAPTLPSRSVFRPRSIKVIPQGRSRPVTTMFRNPSTGAVERSPPLDRKLHRHSLINIPTPPMSPDTPLLSKRMSLPLRVAFEPTSRLSPEPTVIERPEPSPTWQGAESTESERRSASIRERIMKQKQEKEREISEIVARTVGLPKTDTQRDHSVQQVDEDRQRSDKIEERLLRLEQNNDAWLKSMKPLLENMAKILKDMREGGTRHPSLRMSDFIVDMEVEASRFSMYSQRPNVGDSMKQAADFPGFDGASEQMGDHAEEEEATDTRAEPAEIRPKPAETRPNLRLEISETPEAREMTGDVHAAEADAAEADAAPRRPSTGTPRTPREHEFEAQASIKRRIQQQEAMMENLLARWGTPTQRSSQLDEISLEDKNRSTPESTRKQNGDSRSVATSKSVENAEDLDPMIGEPRRGPKSEARLVKDVPEDGRLEYKDKRGDNSLNPLRLNPLMREPSSASHLSAEG
ncbi:hypothetical protein F4780DRAFT_797521 [Xylariomycetidae sp. FL0641]|nr:hypothetical protein F4780DRAFT_797521 [Xylariomycetidae sp. FL0641]